MSRLLVTNEKHGQRFIFAGDSKADLEKAAAKVVRDRLEDTYMKAHSYWDDDTRARAEQALSKGRAYSFLGSRERYEYEGFVIEEIVYPNGD